MWYLYLVVVPLALALVAPTRRPGQHARTAAPERPHPAPVRSARVRPYVSPIPATAPPVYEVAPRAALVRPYVRTAEHRCARRAVQPEEAQARAADSRHGLTALTGLGHPVPMWHCPVPGCQMAAPTPVSHPCPLASTTPDTTQPILEGAR